MTSKKNKKHNWYQGLMVINQKIKGTKNLKIKNRPQRG
jgi:hypothetical protein